MSKPDLNSLPPEVVDDVIQMVQSVNGMIAKFKALRTPIMETSNSVPVATKQLDKVTEETEKATHQMLDLIEGIIDRDADTLDRAETIRSENELESNEHLEQIIQNTEQSQNDSFMLMDALQFQDITSQQINHANAILEEIESKLLSLLELTGEHYQSNPTSRFYDPNATTEGGNKRQKTVDEIIKSQEEARKEK